MIILDTILKKKCKNINFLMIKKLFYCSLFILIIIASLFLWPFVEIPFKETSIIGDYSANKYNPNNDLIRYIIFISIPVLFFILTKSYKFKENIYYFNDKFKNNDEIKLQSNHYLNLLFFFLFVFVTIEFLSIDFPLNKIDTFHEGQQMSSAFKYRNDGSLWSGSYVTVGIFFETIASNLIWNFFNTVSIGATRYLNLFFIYFLKILIIINLFQISIISKLNKNLQLVFLFFSSLVGLDLIDYYHQVGQFIWREIIVFLTLIIFFQIFITPKYTNIILPTIGPISCLSVFWSLDRGINCNLLVLVILIYLLLSKRNKSLIISIFSLFASWFISYLYFGEEFKFFVENTISTLSEINQIGGIVHPIPFSDDLNSSRATKTLILISLSTLISLYLLFLKKASMSKKFILCISIISIIAFLSYGYATGRSDGPHIKSSFGFVIIFYSIIILYFFLNYLNNFSKFFTNKKILLFLILVLSYLNFNINFQNIINYKERINKYIGLEDRHFLKDNEIQFIKSAQTIVKDYDCIQLFTNDAMLLYLLRKPSCSIYYFPIVIGSKKSQIKLINSLDKTNIVISDTHEHKFSSNYRLKYAKEYINKNYSNIYEQDVWIIKKKISK
tara:strand:+ start:3257 stop:5104 length:1848 start_codon:yes stop_codon:yes gene_type:complete